MSSAERTAHRLLPVTVSQLLSARQVGRGAFVVGGVELNQVSVVGVVRSSAPCEAMVRYRVDDMTGPALVVERWGPAEATPFSPGTYVKVIGCLRGRQGEKALQALSVRPLQDPNEITSHMMEVVQAHMQLFGKAFDVNMNPTAGAGAAGVLPGGLSTVQGQVLHAVRTFAASRNGVSFRELRTQLDYLSTADLRQCLAFLVSEGHVYLTIDGDHFKPTEH